MARYGIFIGDKEVSQRYVGSQLVWQKVKLLLEFGSVNMAVYYSEHRPSITSYRTGEIDGNQVVYAMISNKKITDFTLERYGSFMRLVFKDLAGLDAALETLDWKKSSGYYAGQSLALYGG